MEIIEKLQQINKEIKELIQLKENLEFSLQVILEHNVAGSCIYDIDNYKVTLTTGYNYRLDKEKYLDYLESSKKIDARFTPVKQIMGYEINKKAIRDLAQYGTNEDKLLLANFITATDKKLHVKIEEQA